MVDEEKENQGEGFVFCKWESPEYLVVVKEKEVCKKGLRNLVKEPPMYGKEACKRKSQDCIAICLGLNNEELIMENR